MITLAHNLFFSQKLRLENDERIVSALFDRLMESSIGVAPNDSLIFIECCGDVTRHSTIIDNEIAISCMTIHTENQPGKYWKQLVK